MVRTLSVYYLNYLFYHSLQLENRNLLFLLKSFLKRINNAIVNVFTFKYSLFLFLSIKYVIHILLLHSSLKYNK